MDPENSGSGAISEAVSGVTFSKSGVSLKFEKSIPILNPDPGNLRLGAVSGVTFSKSGVRPISIARAVILVIPDSGFRSPE